MQEEDYMTDKDRIAYHLRELREGFPSRITYHAQELEKLLPKEEVERIVNSKLDDIAELNK